MSSRVRDGKRNTTYMHSGKKRRGIFCIACCNAPPAFQIQEGVFNQMALFIKLLIIWALNLPIAFRWNHCLNIVCLGIIEDFIRIIAPICKKYFHIQPLKQGQG